MFFGALPIRYNAYLTVIYHQRKDLFMITWQETLDFHPKNSITAEYFTEDAIFFDIETTGFSPASTSVYLIGCATRSRDSLYISQFFAESGQEETEIIIAFFSVLKQYRTILSFNGIGFDIPYLKAKCNRYHLNDPFPEHDFIDLYKEVSRIKHLLKLPNLKQKSIEIFLGIDRQDTFGGGELIEVYQSYTRRPTKEALALLKQHNFEDVLYMPKLLPVLSYRKLADGNALPLSLAANEYTTYEQTVGRELFFTLSAGISFPAPLSYHYDGFHLHISGERVRLRVRLYDGELRHYYENYRDYYYLPDEDKAIHKSVSACVDREHRTKATASNCYLRKHALFLPQFKPLYEPAFRVQRGDKKSYFVLSDEFISSVNMQTEYVNHILQSLILQKPKPPR